MTRVAVLSPLAGLALGAGAGWVFSRLGTPIPWMLGPLLTLAVLRVAGAPITSRRSPDGAMDHRDVARPVFHAARGT